MPVGMMDPVATLLESLRDIDGVVGSFVLGGDGGLMAWDVPPPLTEATLDEIGQRIVRLADMFDVVVGSDLRVCTIAFGTAKLFINRTAPGFLCILTDPRIQLTATRMAATVVAREIQAEIRRHPLEIVRVGERP